MTVRQDGSGSVAAFREAVGLCSGSSASQCRPYQLAEVLEGRGRLDGGLPLADRVFTA
jgi:hypothetical protein